MNYEMKGVQIYETGDDQQNTAVQIDVPVTFYTIGKDDLADYERKVQAHLRIYASSIFQHIAYLGFIAEDQNLDGQDLHGILDALGNFGKGLVEAMEVAQMSFERAKTEAQK